MEGEVYGGLERESTLGYLFDKNSILNAAIHGKTKTDGRQMLSMGCTYPVSSIVVG